MNFHERYQYNPTCDLIGKGGFSRVFKATDKLLEREVALKVYSSSASEKYDLVNEIRKVIAFEHPNLCRYYDVALLEGENLMGETEKYQVGIMEYLEAGDIRSYVNKHPEHLKKLLKDVLEGLSYLHRQGIIHRDIKPQNILIKETKDGPVAKITDFGISKAVDNDHSASSSLLGTIEYMAPEQFNPAKYGIDGKISTNLDLWSFAMLVYELVIGKPMFGTRNTGTSAEQMMSNILGTIDPAVFDALQDPYKKIIQLGLVKDAKERAKKAEEMIELLDQREKTVSRTEHKAVLIEESPELETVVLMKNTPTPEVVPEPVPTKVEPEKPKAEILPSSNYTNSKKKRLLFAIPFVVLAAGAVVVFNNKKESRPVQTTQADTTISNDPEVAPEESRLKQPGKSENTTPKTEQLRNTISSEDDDETEEVEVVDHPIKSNVPVERSPKERYTKVNNYVEGMAKVELNGMYGFIDLSGREIVKPKYTWANDFCEGRAAVSFSKMGFIDKTGAEVIARKYDYAGPFFHGLAQVKLNGKWGCVDKSGNEVIALIYQSANPYLSADCVWVELNGKKTTIFRSSLKINN